ncbi:phage tail protein [Marinobacter sp. 1-3A]|uniref:phage tail protein n=1 Tax=Marinobacter sp. 1-3A TaxID=2582920 RepID=UPI0019044550|nr:phage tail protein [Marinobacter sp. 1-3A]MBK1874585.1 phage tail protein [Marinobacter sp. 1-3A]
MKKLADLRAHILANVPSLKRNPDKLLTFIEDGNIEFWQGANLSHNYTLPVRLIVTDYAGEVDHIIIPILSWLQIREPGHDPMTTLSFEAELLNNDSYDISVTVNITERVIVKATPAGLDVEHVLPEPPLVMNDDAEWQIISDLHGLSEPVENDQ